MTSSPPLPAASDPAAAPATATAIATDVRTGRRSAVDVVTEHLATIGRSNAALGALTVVFAERALEAAADVDAIVARGDDPGPLAGVPFSVKENIDLTWSATTNGWRGNRDNIPARDATIVRRMRRAGGIPIGRGNMPDFGMRWDTDNDLFGRTRNPWNPHRTAGGSSGGDAVAVAAGMAAIGLGNDYGGSVRIPAAAVGIAGLRPSLGRVPRSAVRELPVAMTLQQFAVHGPLARSVDDLALVLGVLQGADADDPVSLELPVSSGAAHPRRVGVVRDPGGDAHPDVSAAVDRAAEALAAGGWETVAVDLPHLDEAAVLWRRLACTDMLISLDPERLGEPLGASATAFLRDSTAAALPYESAREYSDAWGRRAVIAASWRRLQREFPVILGPVSTAPTPAPDYDLGGGDQATEAWHRLRLTVVVNFLGLPAVAVPAGWDRDRMPVGVQLIGPMHGDHLALAAARDVEAALARLSPGEASPTSPMQ